MKISRRLRLCCRIVFFLLGTGAIEAEARTWKDVAGRTLEADLVKVTGDSATLKRLPDGVVFTLPIARLSAEDQAFIKAQGVASDKGAAKPGKDLYDEVKDFKKEGIPMAGEAHPKLGAVDAAVLEFMAGKGIPAVGFAVSKNGKLIHDRSFGWGDADLKTPLAAGLAMRLASISKPITHAAIESLIETGKLKAEDKVFEVLELAKLNPKKLDERWQAITIQHLIEHKGGFDREKSGDSTYNSVKVCADLRIDLQDMQPMDLVRWYLDRPLDFDPGAREVYSNFGYILLARVVEKVSGKSFVEYLNDSIGKEAGMTTLRVSRSDPRDRLPGEVWYCFNPEYTKEAKYFPVRMETKDGSGALACSAADYCRFLEHYAIDGKPRIKGGIYLATFFGSTPGCTSACCQRKDGIVYTVICNRRLNGVSTEWNKELKSVVDQALDAVAGDL